MRKKKANDDLIYFSKKWICPLSLSVEIEDNIRIVLSSSKKMESNSFSIRNHRLYQFSKVKYIELMKANMRFVSFFRMG